ncbi:MAG: sporulation protein YunB [Oscillospiraceae bacterium]|nr:sporulation protein YunB [Oscillospiraceae bacterium]
MMRRFRRVRILLPRRWYMRGPRWGMGRRVPRGAVYAAAALAAFWIAFAAVSAHIRPIAAQMASARVGQLVTRAIHDAILRRLHEDGYTYESLIRFEKGENGQITALKTDMLAVNRLQGDIVRDVLEAIRNAGTPELGIPLGNVTGVELLSGRGPRIPVRIVPVGTAGAELTNVFSEAGINQTRHQIVMTIRADVGVLMPGRSEVTEVTVQISVAETVIVGTVPDSYASIRLE